MRLMKWHVKRFLSIQRLHRFSCRTTRGKLFQKRLITQARGEILMAADSNEKEEMKILILDIDGVINLDCGISDSCMNNLHEIVKSTKCKISLSSTWRSQLLINKNGDKDSPWYLLCQKYPFLRENKFVADTQIIRHPPKPIIVESKKSNEEASNALSNDNDSENDCNDCNDCNESDEKENINLTKMKMDWHAEYRRGIEIYQFVKRMNTSSKFKLVSWVCVDDMMLNQSNYHYLVNSGNGNNGNEKKEINFETFFKGHFVETNVKIGLTKENCQNVIDLMN